MRIEAGARFLFAKAPIYKGFSIPFNDNRLYGDSETVTVEPVCFCHPFPVRHSHLVIAYLLTKGGSLNERSEGCAFRIKAGLYFHAECPYRI